MTSNPVKLINHIGRFGFDLYDNEQKLVSAGQDCVFKLYDITEGDLKLVKQYNSEDVFDLSVNQATNDIYLGYYESKNVIKVNDIDYIDEIIGEEVTSFVGPVYRVKIGAGNQFIAVSSQENKGYLIKIKEDGSLLKKYLNDNHCGSCLFTTVDRDGEYALTVGCDGNMHIYNIKNFEEGDALFDAALNITFPMVTEREYIMECSFNSQKEIAAGGNASLQLITRDHNGKWILNRIPDINHSRICQWIDGDKYLITAGVERDVKLWNFQEKLCLGTVSCEENITSIRYSKVNNSIFIGDSEGNLYRWNDIDFEKMTQKAKLEQLKNIPKVQQKVESEVKKTEVVENKKIISTTTPSAVKQEINKKIKALDNLMDEEEQENIQESGSVTKSTVFETTKVEQKIIDPKLQKKMNLDALDKLVEQQQKSKENPQPKEKIITNGSIQTPTKELNDLDINEKGQQQKRQKKNLKIQEIIYPSQVSKQLNRSCLIWNLVGQIILREEDKDLFLDFDFTDREMYTKITLKNLHNYQLAAMNKQGFILASKAISSQQEYDGEEDFERFEFHQDAYNFSFIYFQSLNKAYKTTWSLKLSQDENAETVAIGDGWCAVQTDFQYIRIYSFSSMEQHCFCIDKPVVCISGYKNLLAIVYLDGEPICGCQSIKLKFFDANTGEVLKEVGVPITPFTTLSWFGFSEEGLVLTKDSKGIIRALVGYNTWTPIYEQPPNKNFWLKGMVDYQMVGFILPKDEIEPRLTQVQNEKCIEMQLPLPSGDFFENIEEYKLLRHKQLILKHEQFRYQNIEQSQRMEEEIQKIQKDIDLKVLKIFQKCLASGEYQRGFQVVKCNIINPTYIDGCILIAQKAKQHHLEQQLQQLLQVIFIENRYLVYQSQFNLTLKERQSQSQFIQSVVQAQMKPSQKNLIIVSQTEQNNTKLKQANKLLVENHKADPLDSSDEEDNKNQKGIQEQENSKQILNAKQNSGTKSGENDKTSSIPEKKTIGNNPFIKQAKQTNLNDEGLFSANNKKRKDESLIQQKPKDNKKLKF